MSPSGLSPSPVVPAAALQPPLRHRPELPGSPRGPLQPVPSLPSPVRVCQAGWGGQSGPPEAIGWALLGGTGLDPFALKTREREPGAWRRAGYGAERPGGAHGWGGARSSLRQSRHWESKGKLGRGAASGWGCRGPLCHAGASGWLSAAVAGVPVPVRWVTLPSPLCRGPAATGGSLAGTAAARWGGWRWRWRRGLLTRRSAAAAQTSGDGSTGDTRAWGGGGGRGTGCARFPLRPRPPGNRLRRRCVFGVFGRR